MFLCHLKVNQVTNLLTENIFAIFAKILPLNMLICQVYAPPKHIELFIIYSIIHISKIKIHFDYVAMTA